METRKFLAPAGACLVAAVALLLLVLGSSERREAEPTGPGPAPGTAAIVPGEKQKGSPAPAAGAEEQARKPVEEPEEAATPGPAPSDLLAVQVVHAASDLPASGAVLRWHAAQGWSGEEELPEGLAGPSHSLGDGTALVPRPPHAARLTASQPGLWAETHFAPGFSREPVRLELERDHTLRVRVVDQDGLPVAGIAVQLEPEANGRQHRFPHALGVTGEDGRIAREHFQVFGRGPHTSWSTPGAPARRARLRAAVHGAEIWVPLDLEKIPEEEVLLVAPATGRLTVRLADAEGRPLPQQVPVHLQVHQAGRWEDAGSRLMAEEAGEVVFPRVLAGSRVRARAHLGTAGGGPPARPGAVIGPMEGEGPPPGGEAVLELRVPAGHPVLRGCAVDGEGTALSGQRFLVRLMGPEGSATHQVRAGPEGDFLCLADPGWVGHLLEVHIEDRAEGRRSGPPGDRGSMPRLLLAPGENDLGTVVLSEPPLLVAGRVVDEEGRPLSDPEGLHLIVQRAEDVDAAALRAGTIRSTIGARTRTRFGEDGSFEVHGHAPPGRLALVSGWTEEGFAPLGPVWFHPGQRDLMLVVRRWVPLDLRVEHGLAPEMAGWLDVVMAEQGTGEGYRGFFRFLGLPAGDYVLEARLFGDPVPVLRRPGIRVAPGEGRQEIAADVRALLRTVQVRVADQSGEPLAADLRVHDAGLGQVRMVRAPEGVATLPIAASPRAFTVEASGFRRRHVEGVREDVTVVLEPGLAVEVRVALGEALPEDASLRLALGELPVDGMPGRPSPGHRGEPASPASEQEPSFLVVLPAEGDYRPVLTLEHDGGRNSVLLPARPEVLSVEPPAAGRQVLRVTVEPAALHQALRALGW